MKYPLLTIISLTLFLSSCHTERITTIDLQPDFKKYFNYKIGSYWVYYDSLNSNYDSLYVTDYVDEYINSDQTSSEKVTISMLERDYSSNLTSLDIFIKNKDRAYLGIGYNASYRIAEQYPLKSGIWTVSGSTAKTIDNNYAQLTIGSRTYSNVHETIFVSVGEPFPDTIYTNATEGLIGMFFNNQDRHKRLFLVRNQINR